MTRIKHEVMVGTGGDMCNLPENNEYNHHIMAYRKDVTGEILSTVPSQPNLLITHKNSMYMSGYWDSSSSVLSWRLLNLGDGSDILTTTTTTTTTTTIPEPTRYVINGSFAVKLFYPQMVMVDPNGDERIVDVEFENPSTGLIPSYDAYVVTTTFNPVGYKLKVSGRDSMALGVGNYWAGEITLPNLMNWMYIPNANEYYISRTFTSSILTTTSTTTTTAAPISFNYTINVSGTNVSLSSLDVTVTNSRGNKSHCFGVKHTSGWTFNFAMPVYIVGGWTFEFSGISNVGRESYIAKLLNQSFTDGVCTIRTLNLVKDGFVPSRPGTDPLPLDDPGDTNSLDGAINDYLNE